jgi:hypothetical protein
VGSCLLRFEARCLKKNNAVLLPGSTTRDALVFPHDVATEFDHSISFVLVSFFLMERKLKRISVSQ